MKRTLRGALLGAFFLAGCSAADRAIVTTAVGAVCALDAAYVPLADNIAALVPQAAPFASVDLILVHPAVVAMCDGLLKGSTPILSLTTAAQ